MTSPALVRASWLVTALSLIPFLGSLFSLAAMVLGVMLITRRHFRAGIAVIIIAPLLSAASSALSAHYLLGGMDG